MTASTERAILAGGCFWGVQDLLRRYNGVLSTRVGYSGGDVPNATYRNHGTHAEALEIVFDPQKLSYRKLLEFFFQIHDPTTLNRQGNDRGPSSPSPLFYPPGEQKRVAEKNRTGAEYEPRSGPGPMEPRGRDRRAQQVVSALHDGCRQMTNTLDSPQQQIIGLVAIVPKIVHLDARHGISDLFAARLGDS